MIKSVCCISICTGFYTAILRLKHSGSVPETLSRRKARKPHSISLHLHIKITTAIKAINHHSAFSEALKLLNLIHSTNSQDHQLERRLPRFYNTNTRRRIVRRSIRPRGGQDGYDVFLYLNGRMPHK